MPNHKISINLVVYNGEKYIRQCLDSVLRQSYPHELMEINILDNNSTDGTVEIIKSLQFTVYSLQRPRFNFVESKLNLGMWPGQEFLLGHSHGEYVVALSVDVILHPDFIKNAVEVMEQDKQIGALQAKVYKYELNSDHNPICSHRKTVGSCDDPEILDTCGFEIYKSRRIVNVGHGEEDRGQYDFSPNTQAETRALNKLSARPSTEHITRYVLGAPVFAVEGAVPVFRRQALEDCRLKSQTVRSPTSNSRGSTSGASSRLNLETGLIIDPDFFWYGDDLDLAWRMRLFGWKQIYAPSVIAWHDRKTTKALAGSWKEFIKIRRIVPMFKRRLDWRNTTLAIIKNDFTANLLRDLPYIIWRQLRLWTYFLIFEPVMILEIFKVAKLLPRMLKRRSEIMQKIKISAKDFRQWIN